MHTHNQTFTQIGSGSINSNVASVKVLSKGRTERSAHLARLRLRDTQDMSETDPRREYIRQAIVHALGPPSDWVSHKVAGSAICVLMVLPDLAYERVRRHSIHKRVYPYLCCLLLPCRSD